MMKKIISFGLFLFLSIYMVHGKEYAVSSPDGRISLKINTESFISWTAWVGNQQVIETNRIGIVLTSGKIYGENETVKRAINNSINEIIKPVVAHKHSEIKDQCNTLDLFFKSGLILHFRAYNDGFAYRFETQNKEEITIENEIFDFTLPENGTSWYPLEDGFMSHNERLYIYSKVDTLKNKHLASLPALFQVSGINLLITESDVEDYPGMWLKGAGDRKMTATWPKYPENEKLSGDRDMLVTSTYNYIAKTMGTRTFPWRAFVVAENDGKLIESDLVYKLAAPNRIAETDWIKPGNVAWDWWNANNIYGADFQSGVNTETYKYYIDFASKYGIDYIILDEGWYKLGNVLDEVPEIDVEELCRYGKERNVGVILWVVWKTFEDQMDAALTQYEKWGVKGVKVDFMQRDDQKMVNFYYEAAQKTAEHHMLIDFHGSYKPDGLGRTYPNALTREGVKGLENNKWSYLITPEHDVTLPFIRMVAGPMDYTPGAMINKDKMNFRPSFTIPESQGTRAHQMALYVIYESPLQMLADNPSNYMKEHECTEFIARVPVVWDDIKVLDGKVGDYLLLARRSGNDWYVAALTDWTSRSLEVDLSFLPTGSYNIELFSDGVNANRYAIDYKHENKRINQGDSIKINLAQGGGWVAKITPAL